MRREDMRKLLEATGGKVFTLVTLEHLVDHTDLLEYANAPFPPERGGGNPH